MKRKSKSEFPRWTIAEASRLLVVTQETLRRKLLLAGLETGPGTTYSPGELFRALQDPLTRQRIRETRARADILEDRVRAMKAGMLPRVGVESYLKEVVAMVHAATDRMPGEVSRLCNPADPLHARQALEGWAAELRTSTTPREGGAK